MIARIPPVDPARADAQTQPLFEAVKAKMGKVPNMMKTMAHSPGLLESYLSFSGALNKGVLPEVVRQQIALFVSQENGCEYCVSAHTMIGRHAGLTREQTVQARQGHAADAKQQAVLDLVQSILDWRGDVTGEQFTAAQEAGLTEAEIVEIVGHVALTTFTNYINQLSHTVVDFPRISLNLEPNSVLQA
jgi:uncharacterized peroxidase-related enzyme